MSIWKSKNQQKFYKNYSARQGIKVYFDSEVDGCVTVRDRDTMEQERIKIEDLVAYIEAKMEF